METVGMPLKDAAEALTAGNIAFSVTVTRPTRHSFPLAEDMLYVVRELRDEDGGRRLLVAAKMGKAPS
ncbi:hypothetical protein [Anaeroselena agilis]|uniref:Uncharacterized protein n=1 Tax=Anaeroselena agilis TaxID=3063788 RepID=A0ABU3NWZ0_9FIRM|nr:hypothetical protein [Selenomonadales bacterium 4137-cl]